MYAMMGLMLIVMLGLMTFVILGQVQQAKQNKHTNARFASLESSITQLQDVADSMRHIMETQEYEIKQLQKQVDIHRRIINSTVRRNIKSS